MWAVPVDEGAAAAARAAGTLSAAERARAGELVRPADRDLYLVAHVALRELLAGYVGVPPSEVALEPAACVRCGERPGRPLLPGSPGLTVSLSHSAGLAVVAVATDPLGVDTESRDAGGADIDALTAYLHPEEQRVIAAHPPEERRLAFLRCWVRKEAYLKGRGIGLNEELDSSNVSAGANGRANEVVRGWRLAAVPAAETHLTAIALLLPPDHARPRVRTRTHLLGDRRPTPRPPAPALRRPPHATQPDAGSQA